MMKGKTIWQNTCIYIYIDNQFLNSSHSICNSPLQKIYSGLDGYLLWFITAVLMIFYYPLCSVDPNDQKKTACYDIDVEVEDPLKGQMSSFLLSTANQQEITALDNKVLVQEYNITWHIYIYCVSSMWVWCHISKRVIWERDFSFGFAFKGWTSHMQWKYSEVSGVWC